MKEEIEKIKQNYRGIKCENGNTTAKQCTSVTSGNVSSAMGISGRTVDSGLEVYRYDKFNRLIKYNSGSAEASYTYNADNLRTGKTVNRTATTFVWNGQNLASETTNGSVNTYTYDATGVHIANQNGTVYSYLKDHHGNIIGTATSAGAMVQETTNRMDYDAFGNQWIGDTPDPFGYCGEYLDSESGLIYLRNRYYDNESGRFITEDPVKDGLNWYSYCGGNPVMCIDPWGLVITLVGNEDEMNRSFEQLKKLTNDEFAYDEKTGLVTIVNTDTMNKNKTLTAGSQMIRELIANDDFNVKIKRVNVEKTGCYVYYEDDGATIHMNDWAEVGDNWHYVVSDGLGDATYDYHKDVAHIVLGHELIHATHHMNGTLADSSRGVYRYTSNGLEKDERDDVGSVSEEYNTTGLNYIVEYPIVNNDILLRRIYVPVPGSLTENTLRKEQGLSRRLEY